jgi:predicted RNA-binding protein with TRAM domain
VIKVKSEAATLSDIKVGDTVTIRIERTTDVYAKEIRKK